VYQKNFHVYILTNALKTVLYIGVTNDLQQRICEHYQNRGQQHSFCGRYNVYWLIYYEEHQYINDAIVREKEMKGWRREKKMQLIAQINPALAFLNEEIFGKWPPAELTTRV
jgi:putative endonuclease